MQKATHSSIIMYNGSLSEDFETCHAYVQYQLTSARHLTSNKSICRISFILVFLMLFKTSTRLQNSAPVWTQHSTSLELHWLWQY